VCSVKTRSQWPCGLRRRFAAARLLKSWVRIPPGAWMFVCCDHLSRGVLPTVVCCLETSRMRMPWPALGHSTTKKKCSVKNSRTVWYLAVVIDLFYWYIAYWEFGNRYLFCCRDLNKMMQETVWSKQVTLYSVQTDWRLSKDTQLRWVYLYIPVDAGTTG